MGPSGKRWGLAAIAALCAVLTTALPGPADAARVTVGKLVLHADGGFAPRQLPRRTYAPIRFQGHAEIAMKDGSVPPAVQRIRLDFDRDGRLTTGGLAVCHPEQIQGATTEQARSRCGAAEVGNGNVEATAELPFAGRLSVRAPLTIFNGPRQGRVWTVLAHAQTSVPLPETYVVVIPVERRSGAYGYRATFDLPPLLGGFGSLTHVDAKIGRRYRAAGRERSFISARCSDGILQTQGFASFANGDVISGSLFKYCTAVG
jgi:hypothetical protein